MNKMNERSIFLAALEIADGEQRQEYLDEACGDDDTLREQVRQLLIVHEDADEFLEKPPAEFVATIATGDLDTVDEGGGDISLDFLEESEKPGCIGTLGAYEVVDVVGRGGMGLVLRAHDPKLNRVVAIKVMAPELAVNQMAVKRFLREAQAAAAVSHDHIVTIFAIDEENRPPFIVMEYVDGQSLQEKIDKEGALELKEILRIGMQTASGLVAPHKQGLVHRDIKPANILLENGIERVKITDFGLARAVDDVGVTQTGQIAGTPQYMSPEQAQGHPVDARTDLFSLGSVLYTMCTGRPAFRADNAVAVLRRVADDDPRPIHEVNADIPDWLEAIVSKLLAKDVDDRFESAEEVADLLSNHLAHLQHPTTAARPAAVTPPKPKMPPKHMASPFETPSWTESRKRFSTYLAIVLLLIGVIITAAAIIYVKTDNGTLVIKTQDPNARILVKRDGKEIQTIEVKQYVDVGDTHEAKPGNGVRIQVNLRSGDYEIELLGSGTLQLSKNQVTIRRGHSDSIQITRETKVGPSVATIDSPDRKSQITEVARFDGHDEFIWNVAAAPDGRHVVSVSKDGLARVWDISRKKEVSRFSEHKEPPHAVAVAADGSTVATGDNNGVVFLWDLLTGRTIRKIVVDPSGPCVHCLAISPDGNQLATGSQFGRVRLWEVATGEEQSELDFQVNKDRIVFCLAYSPDGTRLAAGTSTTTAVVWDLKSRQVVHSKGGRTRTVRSVAWSPDGRLLAVGDREGHVFIDDLAEEASFKLPKHGAMVCDLHFTADGRHLISSSMDRTLRIWDARTRREIARHEATTHTTNQSVLMPDGRHVLSGGGGVQEGKGVHEHGDGDYEIRLWQLPKSIWPKADAEDMIARTHREATERKLHQIGIAFYNYHDSRRSETTSNFPPAATTDAKGKPLLSWRVRLLPFLLEQDLYYRFHHDEPWDSPHNAKLIKEMPGIYATPGTDIQGRTSVMVFVGDDAPFGGKKAERRNRELKPFPKRVRGPNGTASSAQESDGADHGKNTEVNKDGKPVADQPIEKPRRKGGPEMGEIRDGTSNTILVIQAGVDKAVPWTKPEDLPFDPKNPIAALGKPNQDGWHAVLFDGSVRLIPAKIEPRTLELLINPSDGSASDVAAGSNSSHLEHAGPPADGPNSAERATAEKARVRQQQIESWLMKQTEAGTVREVKINTRGAMFYFVKRVPSPNFDGESEVEEIEKFELKLPVSEKLHRRQMIEFLKKNDVSVVENGDN